MSPLTDEQQETIKELRAELASLYDEADEKWKEWLQTGDDECWQQVHALDGAILMKEMIAHVPTQGELRIGRVRDKLNEIRGGRLYLKEVESRVTALQSINAWRESLELPPLERLPRGRPGDTSECTLAMALLQTARDNGGEDATVSVSGGADFNIGWTGYDGQYHYFSHGDFKIEGGDDLITYFDEWRYLDLVTDDLLGYELDRTCREGVFNANFALAVAAEVKRRGITVEGWVYSSDRFPRATVPVVIDREGNITPSLLDIAKRVSWTVFECDDPELASALEDVRRRQEAS